MLNSRLLSLSLCLTLWTPNLLASEKLAPHAISICSQMLMAAPNSNGEYRGDLHFYLRDMDGVALSALRTLDQRDLSAKEKLRKAIHTARKTLSPTALVRKAFGLRENDFTTPHDYQIFGVFPDPLKISWSPANELRISAIVGRIAQLEEDFVEAKDLIAYGYEIRGVENIKQHLEKILAATDQVEERLLPKLEKQFPYATKTKIATHVLGVGIAGLWIHVFGSLTVAQLHSQSYLSLAGWFFLSSVIFPTDVVEPLRNAFVYARGFVSNKARITYENLTNANRTDQVSLAYANVFEILPQAEKFPEAMIYAGMTTVIPTELRTELLEASKKGRELDLAILEDAIVRDRKSEVESIDRNYLLLDQVLFFDEQTHEPVLASFVRLKRAFKIVGKKKAPPTAEEREESASHGWAPGLAR